MKYLSLILTSFILISVYTSCEKPDPEIPNEEEVITNLVYTLIADGSTEELKFSFEDLDGDGGNEPIISSPILTANTKYSGTLELLNVQTDGTTNISDEILDEDEDHQFFFITELSGVEVEYTDTDENDKPVGLDSELTTGNIGTGTLTIILRHKPNKSADGVASGAIANAGGETDIEVSFDINVE